MQLRYFEGYHEGIGALAWNGPTLTTRGLDGIVISLDFFMHEHVFQTYRGNTHEVCGLTWSPSRQQLTSGGNDNLVYIWDKSMACHNYSSQYLHKLDEHCAQVKSLANYLCLPSFLPRHIISNLR